MSKQIIIPFSSILPSTNNNPFKPNIYIRSEKVGGRRKVTTIEGLDDGELDIKSIIRTLCNILHTNGCETSSTKTKEKKNAGTKIIQVQGDHRQEIKQWLLSSGIIPSCEEERIHVSLSDTK